MLDSMELSELDIDTSRDIPSEVRQSENILQLTGDNSINNMISQHSDLHSLDKKTERVIIATDIEDSLQESYIQMKTKLDELEHYNKTLELQLGDIFKSIGATVKTNSPVNAPTTTTCSVKCNLASENCDPDNPRDKSNNSNNSNNSRPDEVVNRDSMPTLEREEQDQLREEKKSISQIVKPSHEDVNKTEEVKVNKYSSSVLGKKDDLSTIIREV